MVRVFILQKKPKTISDPNLEKNLSIRKKWPSRSPDLNPCDYFLWGYLKSRVYNPLPKDLDDLNVANIEREIKNVSTDTLKNAILNFSKRCDLVIKAKGGHIDNVL